MSGFLQRLASGVLHAERVVRPAVGTIWSAGMTRPGMMEAGGAGEPVESSGEVHSPFSPRRTEAPAPATKPQMRPERNAPVADAAVRADAEQPPVAEAVAFQPLLASSQQRPVAAGLDATTRRSEAISPPDHQPTSPEGSGSQQMNRIESTRPLVHDPGIVLSAMAGARIAPSFPPQSQRHRQRAPSLASEPDSIEIHIGRIEVLAAAPRPAQSAAPRAARKSLDLVEYLRREPRSR
jgi:hypothetical protein